MCGQVDGGAASCLELLPVGSSCPAHELCPPPAVPAHIYTCLNCCWHWAVWGETHTLMPLMMGSTQHFPLLFKEGIGTAQNCPYLLFFAPAGRKG